jgi:hypothetical protein
MPFTTLIEEALEAWRYTRAGVVTEIENLSDVDLRFKPSGESRTPAEIAVHIAESGMMMSGELSRPDGNFRRKSFPEFMKEYARGVRPARGGKRALLQMLKRTHADGERRLRSAGELHLLQLITRFDGERGSRLAWRPAGAVRAARRACASAHAIDLRQQEVTKPTDNAENAEISNSAISAISALFAFWSTARRMARPRPFRRRARR